MPDVDIIATGSWPLTSGLETFTEQDLADALDASTCPSVGLPKIKLGHVDPRFDGEPAVGYVGDMKLTASGNKITGTLTDMPAWLAEILPSAYPDRSMEGQRNFTCQQGHKHPMVITGLALLGVETPAIGVLNDIAALYGLAAASEPEGTGEKWSVAMTEKLFASGVTLDDVRRAYMATAGYSRWITEMQLNPPQLIVCDDDDSLYRVPVKFAADGTITFGDAVPVEVEFVDIAAKARELGLYRPAALYASAEESLAGLGEEILAAWSASTQIRNLGDNPTAAQIKALFAIPGDTKSDSKLPHHTVGSDGTVGAADTDGCSAAIAAINGGRGGLKGVSADQLKAAYGHLAAHLKAAGKEPPELKAAAGGHDAFTGDHEHPHTAGGSQGGDATHSHMHSHSGDASHGHSHATKASDGKTATRPVKVSATGRKARTSNPGGHKVFTDEQLAELRAKLGLDEDAELTADVIMAAVAQVEPEGDPDPEGDPEPAKPAKSVKVAASVQKRLPPGAVVVDQESWDKLQASAKRGEQAMRRMEIGERDGVIQAAVQAGKFTPSRVKHWQRLWDADPDGTREVIASLTKGVVPLNDIGDPGAELTDTEMDEDYKRLFPPQYTGTGR